MSYKLIFSLYCIFNINLIYTSLYKVYNNKLKIQKYKSIKIKSIRSYNFYLKILDLLYF